MKRRPRIEIVPSDPEIWQWSDLVPSDRPHYLRVRAANGEVVLTSEIYATRSNARRAALRLWRTFADIANHFDEAAYDPDLAARPIREVSS